MRVFLTGASGWIGTAVVPELVDAGHEVVGLARSDTSAEVVEAAGAEVLRGDLQDLDTLRAGAASADGVIHLGFIHDFARFGDSVRIDREAIEAMGHVLEGSGRPFVIASGTPAVAPGEVATEKDVPPPEQPRAAAAAATVALGGRGVRSSVLRLPPTVHGRGEVHGFVPTLISVARERGVSGYIGDGSNQWSAVHRLDAARLFRLALEHAPAGSVLHAVGDRAMATRAIAEIIGRKLGIPARSVAPEATSEHFGWVGFFFSHNRPADARATNELLRFRPVHPGLLADLEDDYYFSEPARAITTAG